MAGDLGKISIKVEPLVLIIAAYSFFIIPWKWVVTWICTTIIHELFHCFAIKLCGSKIWNVRISLSGIYISVAPLLPAQEALCAIAGPLASFLICCFSRTFPCATVCAGVQCAINIIPLYPNDGGRVLNSLLELCYPPERAHRLGAVIRFSVLLILFMIALYAAVALRLGIAPALIVVALAAKTKKSLHWKAVASTIALSE